MGAGEALPAVLAGVRAVVGLGIVLFAPGYCLLGALLPRRGELAGPERAALSFGLSAALAGALAPAVDRLPAGIEGRGIAATYAGFMLVCWGTGRWRRRAVAEERGVRRRMGDGVRGWWQGLEPAWRWILAVQAGMVVLGIGVVMVNAWMVNPGERYTEFYLLGPGGLAEAFPQEARAGTRIEVTYGVMNREGEAAGYRVEVWQDGALAGGTEGFWLAAGEGAEGRVTFTPAGSGEWVRFDFWLVREGREGPYRRLALWMRVMG